MIRKPSQLRTWRSLLLGQSEDLIIPMVDGIGDTNQHLPNVLIVHHLAVYDISLPFHSPEDDRQLWENVLSQGKNRAPSIFQM